MPASSSCCTVFWPFRWSIRERRLLGAIDVELYTDELRDLGGGLSDDLFQLVGVHLAWARQLGPLRAFRSRFPWLMCNITGGVAAAFLGGIFQAEIKRVVALASVHSRRAGPGRKREHPVDQPGLASVARQDAFLVGDFSEVAPRVAGGPAAGRGRRIGGRAGRPGVARINCGWPFACSAALRPAWPARPCWA